MTSSATKIEPAKTNRFHEKRERILDAATELMNRHGVKGMTFVDVAQMVDLNTTSITYYFKRKDLLAAAVLDRSLARIETMVRECGAAPTPRERVWRYLDANLRMLARIRDNEERPIAILSDMRALAEKTRNALTERYVAIFRELRDYFGPAESEEAKALRTARAHILVENMFWLPAWAARYSIGDFERVRDRLFEVFDKGIAPEGAPWAPEILEIDEERLKVGIEGMPGNFLRAATRLINERGYRGASVEQIASELNVTKGSFYHHLEAKDDLVLECFARSYGRVSLVQRAATRAGGTHWQQLASSIATLLDVQFFGDFPLLRTTALQALPNELRDDVLDRSNRMARRFAGMMIDGITEGSVRAIDPLIASQVIMASLNTAYEMRKWASYRSRDESMRMYASTLAYGMFDGL